MPDERKEYHLLKHFLKRKNLSEALVAKQESPDFVLDGKIGIEVTDLTPEEYIRGSRAARSEHPGTIVTTHLQHRKERRTTQELKSVAQSTGSQWGTFEGAFASWSLGITQRLEKKHKAFNQDGFKKFPTNILLISDISVCPFYGDPYVFSAKQRFPDFARRFRLKPFFDFTCIDLAESGLITWNHQKNSVIWEYPEDNHEQIL